MNAHAVRSGTTDILEFSFKGDRRYVQGTDMYSGVRDHLVALHPNEDVDGIEIALHRMCTEHCRILLDDTNHTDSQPEGSMASVSFQVGEVRRRGWLTGTGDPVTRRYAYVEGPLLERSTIVERSISCPPSPDYTSIETIVALNKCLHVHLFPELTGAGGTAIGRARRTATRTAQWVFCRLDLPTFLPDTPSGPVRITLEARLGQRMTRSRMEIDGEFAGRIDFSLLRP